MYVCILNQYVLNFLIVEEKYDCYDIDLIFCFCRNVMYNFLEKIDSYLWVKKSNIFMFEVDICIYL